jgi:hypothetical protein
MFLFPGGRGRLVFPVYCEWAVVILTAPPPLVNPAPDRLVANP